MSLKLGQIRPQTTELAALKRLKNLCVHFFLALYNGSQVSIVAHWATCSIAFGKKNIFKKVFCGRYAVGQQKRTFPNLKFKFINP